MNYVDTLLDPTLLCLEDLDPALRLSVATEPSGNFGYLYQSYTAGQLATNPDIAARGRVLTFTAEPSDQRGGKWRPLKMGAIYLLVCPDPR